MRVNYRKTPSKPKPVAAKKKSNWGKPSKDKVVKAVKSAASGGGQETVESGAHDNAVAAGTGRAARAQASQPGKAQAIIKRKRAN